MQLRDGEEARIYSKVGRSSRGRLRYGDSFCQRQIIT